MLPLPVFVTLSGYVATLTETSAVAVPPRPSPTVYVKLSLPSKPLAGV